MKDFKKIFQRGIFMGMFCLISSIAMGVVFDDNSFLLFPDTVLRESPDTVIQLDSIQEKPMKKASSNSLDKPVYYTAKDSNINLIQEEMLILYKEAEIKYDDIKLNADYIRVNMGNREVIAFGMTDSSGNVTGKPVFVQGDETFEADTIRYNFDTKKGIIKNVTSEYDGAYLIGGKTKRHSDETIHMINGKFTTCDLDHPHFYFNLSKAKVIPEDKVVSGPAYLVIEDIPTPLGIPFGFFPNKKGATSGIIIPEQGEEVNRGFFLRNGGYYWAVNDYMDILFTGDIYSKGSWGAGIRSNYKVRYKMSGNLTFVYNANVLGYEGFENYSKNRLYRFKWVHKQDPKAHPSMSFNASVDMSSSAYDKFNSYNPNNYMSNTKQSSVSLSKFWPGTPFSLNATLQHSQNNRDSTVTMTLPNVSFSMSRIYPLKQKNRTGKERFYEKISMSYTMQALNRVTSHEDSLLMVEFDDFDNGIKHSLPINASLKLFKYITVNPYFNFTDRMYFKRHNYEWDQNALNPEDSTYGMPVEREIYGFNNVWDYRTGAKFNTKIYGMWEYKNKRFRALRHVMTPSVDLMYYPDFSSERFNYYASYITDIYYDEITGQYDTISSTYDKYKNYVYGSVPASGAGSVRFSLNNNLEAKVSNPKDTTGEMKKVKLLESLTFNTSYNMLADSLNWSPVNVNGRTTIGKLNLIFNATFDPYAYDMDSTGRGYRVNAFQFTRSSQVARITSAGLSSSVRFSADGVGGEDKNADNFLYGYPHAYVDFSVPWSLSLNYTLNYTKLYDDPVITQSLGVRGDLKLTEKWKVTFGSGYDFVNQKMTYTNIEIHRDLHCWEMSLAVVPFGSRKSYSFQINVKSSLLQDLKLQRKQNWVDNF